ncbi:hypothetical protein VPH35_066017 [Triticum aestivum]|uniref:Uncharacterized protein n=1 Tax=Triticum urartu TaxID=4572 RepID=A0A8R7Q375_TRIUA
MPELCFPPESPRRQLAHQIPCSAAVSPRHLSAPRPPRPPPRPRSSTSPARSIRLTSVDRSTQPPAPLFPTRASPPISMATTQSTPPTLPCQILRSFLSR